MRSAADVRRLLLETWGEQTCQRAADWPDVLARLMKNGGGPSGPRASYAPRVDDAVRHLLNGPAEPDDVWRAFPHFDRTHADILAGRLRELVQ